MDANELIIEAAIDDNFSHPLLDFLIVTLGGARLIKLALIEVKISKPNAAVIKRRFRNC